MVDDGPVHQFEPVIVLQRGAEQCCAICWIVRKDTELFYCDHCNVAHDLGCVVGEIHDDIFRCKDCADVG